MFSWPSLVDNWPSLIDSCPNLPYPGLRRVGTLRRLVDKWSLLVDNCPSLVGNCPNLSNPGPEYLRTWPRLVDSWPRLVGIWRQSVDRGPQHITRLLGALTGTWVGVSR